MPFLWTRIYVWRLHYFGGNHQGVHVVRVNSVFYQCFEKQIARLATGRRSCAGGAPSQGRGGAGLRRRSRQACTHPGTAQRLQVTGTAACAHAGQLRCRLGPSPRPGKAPCCMMPPPWCPASSRRNCSCLSFRLNLLISRPRIDKRHAGGGIM
ncbi:hypothetical protein BS78_02G153500 [Paspalum vaginatum]|nr:hypothetical protein BS78_02G153500 [Paspalum vaginatum]